MTTKKEASTAFWYPNEARRPGGHHLRLLECRKTHSSARSLPGNVQRRSRDRFSDSPFPLKPFSGTLDPQMSPMLGCRRNRDKMQVTAFR
jgi:hypothetical protein